MATHLAIVLKKGRDAVVLSDEAHTYMHLTYDIEEKDLHRGTRQTIISNALSTFGIEDQEGNWYSKYQRSVTGTRCIPLFRGCSRLTTSRFCRESAFDPHSWRISERC